MNIEEKEPEKIAVVDYDFDFIHGLQLGVTVFPSLGDTCIVTGTGQQTEWTFAFPRLKTDQHVLGQHLKGYTVRESLRVYVDPVELRKRLHEQQKVAAQAKADQHG